MCSMVGAQTAKQWLEAFEPEDEESLVEADEDGSLEDGGDHFRTFDDEGDLPPIDQSRQSSDGSRSIGDDAYFRVPWDRQVTDEFWPTWEGEIRFPGPPHEEKVESKTVTPPSKPKSVAKEQGMVIMGDTKAPIRKMTFIEKVTGLTGKRPPTGAGPTPKTGPWTSPKSNENEGGSFYGYSEKPCSFASNGSTTIGEMPLEPYSFTSSCSTSSAMVAGCSFTSTGSNGGMSNGGVEEATEEVVRPNMDLALRALAAAVDCVTQKCSSSKKPNGHRRKQGCSLIDLAALRQEKELRQQHRVQMKQRNSQAREKKSLIDLAAEERGRQLQQQQVKKGEKVPASRFCTQCGGSCQPTFKFCRFCGGEVF